MHIDLKGKVAIVTGGGRGIGRVIAETLAGEGVSTIVTDIRQDLLDAVTGEWEEQGWPGAQLLADVRSRDDCRAVAAAVERDFGRIDILVNNAGVASGARVEQLSEEVWDANLDTNLKGTMLMCQAVIPAMQRRKAGRIINASSFAAIIPSIGGAAYASSKAGVESLTRVLASELGPSGITVNCYAPGMIPTEMNRYAEAPPERQEQLLDTLTLRRWGDPRDIANLVCFLASDLAGYITGAMIDISGGKFATQMPWMAHR
ncbi:MAG TPA: SDR family oxidoreductase [Alphaproteobacteria bacterium]|nr:SDR family oxidoreductase [Alphaproteobacteria bacterium]